MPVSKQSELYSAELPNVDLFNAILVALLSPIDLAKSTIFSIFILHRQRRALLVDNWAKGQVQPDVACSSLYRVVSLQY